MAIKDMTPQTTNIGERIVKNMRICGSGIYTYDISEAPLLHLGPTPAEHKSLRFINVFRPPEVLIANKDKFARVPIITGRHQVVHRDNAKELTVGMVGDSVEYEKDAKDGETYLYTTGTIVAGDGVDAYEQYGQLSVGYDPIVEWENGEHNGVPYHAVLRGFNDVNHLLICKVARGGPQCMVMDSLSGEEPTTFLGRINKIHGGTGVVIFKKIFGAKSKKVAGDSNTISVLLNSLTKGADPKVQVPIIRELAGDSDGTWNEYLDELEAAPSNVDAKQLGDAVGLVIEYYNTHILGDTGAPDPDEPDEKKPDTKGSEGTDDKGMPGDSGTKDKAEEKDAVGDSVDLDAIADKVAERVMKKLGHGQDVAGDTAHDDVVSSPIAGDGASTGSASDEFMKSIWG